MQDYDVTLKSILMRLTAGAMTSLTGFSVAKWLSAELPDVRNLRADMVGRSDNLRLRHIELQSLNDLRMVWRMAEYGFTINRLYEEWPDQVVLYVGQAPMRMPDRIETADLRYRCRMVDIRQIETEPLLDSAGLDDNIVAILGRLSDERAAVRKIVARIAEADPHSRAEAMKKLTILAGLRKLGEAVEREAHDMPITESIMDHDLLGPVLKRGIQQGIERGRDEGERKVVLLQIGKRFGPLPLWAGERIAALSSADLEQVELRLLDAPSLEDLFR